MREVFLGEFGLALPRGRLIKDGMSEQAAIISLIRDGDC